MNLDNLKEFAKHIDLLNTINGGVVNAIVDIVENEQEIVIKVNTPGLTSGDYNVMLNSNKLFIYSLYSSENRLMGVDDDNKAVALPLFNRMFDIPPFVDTGKITAEADDNQLNVYLPFRDKQFNKPRRIDIKR